MNTQPSIGFIVVNRAGELSPMMATSDFLKRSEAGIGFWRIRAKSKTVPVSAGGRLQERQGGEAPLLSSPKQPAALANPSEGRLCETAGEPSATVARPKARVAAPSPAHDTAAGGGAKLTKAERNAGIVADYVRGDTLSVIRARYGISSDGTIYPVLAKAGVDVKRSIRSRIGPAKIGIDMALKPDFSVEATICDGKIVAVKEIPHETDTEIDGESGGDDRAEPATRDNASDQARGDIEDRAVGGIHRQPGHAIADRSVAPSAVIKESQDLTPRRNASVFPLGDTPMGAAIKAEKPKIRDWITQRREEIAEASAYLKTQGIIVSVSNPHAEIKMFRLSDRGGQHFHGSVLDAARALGWEGLV